MELTRLKRILRDRWIVVVVIACLGALGAWAFTGLANQQRQSSFKAEAALAFQPLEGQTISDLADSVEFNYELANSAAAELLADDPGSRTITLDLAGARIVFSALAPTRDEAGEKVTEMMEAFYDVDPLLAGTDVEDRLAAVQQQAVEVEARIQALNDAISPQPDQATLAQIAALDLTIEGLRAAVQELITSVATALPAERAEFQARLDSAEAELASKQAERAALPSTEPGTPTVQQQLELTALQNHLTRLQAEHQRLFLRSIGFDEATRPEPTTFDNLTAGPGSGLVNAGIGFLGGLAVALFGLIFINNTRKTIWLPEDLGVPLLADVPGRRTAGGVGQSWYDNTGSSPRKTAVQVLRSGVEARLAGTGGAIAVAGHRTGAPAVHALVTDLAVSMASAGASVLLVDADLESDTALAEYQIGGPSLSGVLKLSPDSLLLDREVGNIIASAYTIRPNLSVLPSGPPPATPADALAGRQFRSFVQEASKRFDYVVVAVGDARSTAAQVAMQRIGRVALVLTPGRSTEPQVTELVTGIQARQVATLGAVFVQKSEGAVRNQAEPVEPDHSSRRQEPQTAPAASPLTRLSNYPFQGGRGAEVAPVSPLRSLADRVGSPQGSDGDLIQVDSGDDALGSDLFGALSEASAAEAYEAVADYLVTRVEDMLVAVPGHGDFPDALTSELHDNGYLPLFNLLEQRSVGAWLADELHREAPGQASDGIVREMERILGFGSDVRSISFDDWLAAEFFTRHIRRTNGEPFIWHLTSEDGTVQLLAHATRFDQTSIEILLSGLTETLVQRLERDLKAANAGGHADRARGVEGHLDDVHRFQGALGWLVGAEQGRGSWTPDWNLGLRENLAPIQRAGLLPFPVLSEEEIDRFVAVG